MPQRGERRVVLPDGKHAHRQPENRVLERRGAGGLEAISGPRASRPRWPARRRRPPEVARTAASPISHSLTIPAASAAMTNNPAARRRVCRRAFRLVIQPPAASEEHLRRRGARCRCRARVVNAPTTIGKVRVGVRRHQHAS